MTGKRWKIHKIKDRGLGLYDLIDTEKNRKYQFDVTDRGVRELMITLLNELADENGELKNSNHRLSQHLIKSLDRIMQLKKELKVYRKVASCSNCKYHNYDWDIDDGYGGEEYEVCDKGNDITEGICEEWEEF